MGRRALSLGGERLGLAAATGGLLLALAILRGQLVTELSISVERTLSLGLVHGMIHDLAFALVPAAAALALWGASRRAAWLAWIALAAPLWIASGANVLYFSYFGTGLDRWVVAGHLRDLPTVRRSVAELFGGGFVLASALTTVAVLLAIAAWTRRRRTPGPPARPAGRDRTSAAGLLALSLALVAGNEAWRGASGAHSILAEHVLVTFARGHSGATAGRTNHDLTDPRAPARVLAQLRDWDPLRQSVPVPRLVAAPDEGGQLVRDLKTDAALTRALRARLGLPIEGPVHVVLLLLESTRAYEFEHAELGPLVFPKTLAVLARHGVRFPVAYASPITVAETVQGMFATHCSMLPNTGGAPAYVARPDLRIRCLPEIAQEHGYRTLWISGGYKDFHGKFDFDSRHGIEEFHDADAFAGFPTTDRFSDCGYPDRPLLKQAVRLISERAAEGRPVFASILTLSTHHPVTEIPQGPIPPALDALLAPGPYRGYVSRLRYLDESLGEFFSDLFASPVGGRTLVVMLGDHGVRYRPHLPVSEVQALELRARIPLAFVTRDLPAPEVSEVVAHQVDIAPSIAEIAGFSGPVTWIGRSVWSGSGTPWILGDLDELHYRAGDTACYTLLGEARPRCHALTGDPLFAATLPARETDPDLLAFVEAVAAAERQAIALDQIMPRDTAAADSLFAPTQPPARLIGAVMGDQARLVGCDLDRGIVAPGDTFSIACQIEVLADAPADHKLMIRLQSRAPAAPEATLSEHHPLDGLLPLRQLRRGQVFRDVQRVTVAPDFPMGEAQVSWGVGRAETAVPIANPEAVGHEDGRWVLVGGITIGHAPPAYREGVRGEPTVVGCADGQREGFADGDRHPRIAGCAASWPDRRSLRAPPTSVTCGDDAGPCAVPADACAPDWHVCGVDGDVSELREHVDAGTCLEAAGPGRFVAASSHCAADRRCPEAGVDRLPCLARGYCAEPVCCGQDCEWGLCRHGVWPGGTRISRGPDEGCGAVGSARSGGVLCCAGGGS